VTGGAVLCSTIFCFKEKKAMEWINPASIKVGFYVGREIGKRQYPGRKHLTKTVWEKYFREFYYRHELRFVLEMIERMLNEARAGEEQMITGPLEVDNARLRAENARLEGTIKELQSAKE
jgi:hypothetical protein